MDVINEGDILKSSNQAGVSHIYEDFWTVKQFCATFT